jgi:hypothetical protein
MQEVEPDRSSSSDFKGDAAQVQGDRRNFNFQEMTTARCCVEQTRYTVYEPLARNCIAPLRRLAWPQPLGCAERDHCVNCTPSATSSYKQPGPKEFFFQLPRLPAGAASARSPVSSRARSKLHPSGRKGSQGCSLGSRLSIITLTVARSSPAGPFLCLHALYVCLHALHVYNLASLSHLTSQDHLKGISFALLLLARKGRERAVPWLPKYSRSGFTLLGGGCG